MTYSHLGSDDWISAASKAIDGRFVLLRWGRAMISWTLAGSVILVGLMAAQVPTAASGHPPGDGSGWAYCSDHGGYTLPWGSTATSATEVMNVYPCGPNGGYASGDLFMTSWQCVEYAARYLFNRGYEISHYDYGKNFATETSQSFPSLQLVTEGNGQLPATGDIISMWGGAGTDPSGHVAVVSGVTAFDTSGGATINVVEENASAGGKNTIAVTGWGSAMSYNGGSALYDYTQFNWVRLGPSSGSPSVPVRPNAGQQDVFWKGADSNVREANWNNGWHGPSNIGMGPLGSSPTAAVNNARCEDDVFWEGQDANLWEAYWACGSGWHGPSKVGFGPLGSQPAVGVWSNNGQQDVFWKGADSNLWEAYWNNGWHGPFNIGMGPLGSAPTAAVNNARCEDDVFWKGLDGNLWEAYWACGSGWHGPSKVGFGPLGSQPAVGVWSNNGQQDVFWKGADSNLWKAYWNNGWHGPFNVGMGPLRSAPTAAVNNARCEDDVFWKGEDGNLWEAYWACGSGWHGPSMVGVGLLGSQPTVGIW